MKRPHNFRLVSAMGMLALILTPGCSPPPPEPLTPGSFAFGVFGDGPYYFWENGRFQRVLEDVDRADVQWLIHVGDILQYPCTDAKYQERLDDLNSVATAVIYIPGDNEWTDCHGTRQGNFDPLNRLASLRRIFFSSPTESLGRYPIPLASQSTDTLFSGYPENARWTRGGVSFSTLHIVGSSNGLDPFAARTSEHDEEVVERTSAALAWMDQSFNKAIADSSWAVVLALHADLGLDSSSPGLGFESFVQRLEERVTSFPGQVLLIHGDFHEYRLDQPLLDSNGVPLPNFTRLETFGSPDIGWVRVVVDSVRSEIVAFETRVMKGYW